MTRNSRRRVLLKAFDLIQFDDSLFLNAVTQALKVSIPSNHAFV
jgi:hypothetical protein